LIFWFTRRTAPSAASRAVSKSTVATVTTAEPGGTPAPSPNSAQAASSAPPRSSKAQYRVGGVVYQVRWGDTLWDLSLSFYRTPWLYGKIAKANRIKNPNLIFAHSQIYIPER
jgi:nucleoid-associated protein YgaU